MKQRTYIAIDLKSFYASVECMDRGLDPLTTNLVVADASRTDKTICLAVTPSLKKYGISGRARLFEVVQRVRQINAERARKIGGKPFTGKSCFAEELERDPELELDYITAVPRMAEYMKQSAAIYQIYLQYVSPEDIPVSSIDEVFIDATGYLGLYGMTAHELATKMIHHVMEETRITATAGIGTNLYLAKVAMDIWAKKVPPDEHGVRIAELDERSYRENLWTHEPIRDFWRIGGGIARRLASHGLYTMGDVARCSAGGPNDYYNAELLYKMFGVNAELLIDHAWGIEPCTMSEIKAYRPKSNSLSSGQVLSRPYDNDKALVIVREMTDAMIMDLTARRLVTDQIVLTISYDIENLKDPERRKKYHGPVVRDYYGRLAPQHAHGTANLPKYTASAELIMNAVVKLYERITDPVLLVRRISLTVNHICPEGQPDGEETTRQISIFDLEDEAGQPALAEHREQKLEAERKEAKEKDLQNTLLSIRKKYGKNSILKGTSYEEGATARDRNNQIGGHRA
ncbi:MAG: DNA methylase [Mogibacterium sp.]|nr:DNA methylase [Mogibacterium sp.]